VLLVGRHPECDVRIDLPKVSRRHCCLALAYERVVIRDLGSRNGLRVNGRVVEEAQLSHGDEVAIGPLIFRVDDPETAAQQATALSRPTAAGPSTPESTGAGAGAGSETCPPSLPHLPAGPSGKDSDLVPIDF